MISTVFALKYLWTGIQALATDVDWALCLLHSLLLLPVKQQQPLLVLSFAGKMKGPFPSSSYVTVQSLKPAIDLGPHKDVIMDVFFSFHIIGGHVALPLTLVTMVILKTVARRHPTLINLLISWVVYATANLLLYANSMQTLSCYWLIAIPRLYSGERNVAKPDFGVCLAQASMIYGSTVG